MVAELVDALDVARGVDQVELVVRGRDRPDDVEPVDDADLTRERHREVDADRRHGVGQTEVVLGQVLVEDDARALGHAATSKKNPRYGGVGMSA